MKKNLKTVNIAERGLLHAFAKLDDPKNGCVLYAETQEMKMIQWIIAYVHPQRIKSNKKRSKKMKVICDKAGKSEGCQRCESSNPHQNCGHCSMARCFIVNDFVQCVPYEKTQIIIPELKSEPLRELTLEEIAVAAMSAWITSQGTIKTVDDLANRAYNIAEAMKAEKERREKE